MGEFELIGRLSRYLSAAGDRVILSAGDDAAVVALGTTCLTVDVLVEDVHFDLALSSLEDVGWKAIAVNASDVAAMGGRPVAAVVGLTRPASLAADAVERLYAGMQAACRRWDVALVGGDTVSGPALSLAVTMVGDVAPGGPVTRAGARPGDRLILVGALGAAAAGLALARAGRHGDPGLLAAHRRPQALVAAAGVLADGGARALIDLSDGLGADLGHLCVASVVSARIQAATVPVAAGVEAAAAALSLDPWRLVCAGGEDFALLAAAAPGGAEELARRAGDADDVPAAVIGRVVEPGSAPSATLELPDGRLLDLTGAGYDHYAGGDHTGGGLQRRTT